MSFNVAQLFCIATFTACAAVLPKSAPSSEKRIFLFNLKSNFYAYFLIFLIFIQNKINYLGINAIFHHLHSFPGHDSKSLQKALLTGALKGGFSPEMTKPRPAMQSAGFIESASKTAE